MKGTVLNPLDSDAKAFRINVATYAGRKHVTVVITHDLDQKYAKCSSSVQEDHIIPGLDLKATVYAEAGCYTVNYLRPDGADENAEIENYILTALKLFLLCVSKEVTHNGRCDVLISGLMPSLLNLLLRIDTGSPTDFMAYISKAGITNYKEVHTMLNAYMTFTILHFRFLKRLIPPSDEEISCANFQAGLYADSDAELIGGRN